ncbi:MAG TPA: TetR/AcrR family transcriptional regulator [Syntrophomonadaceae bacterium]|nr:TetR/AcrR family transcriptional regulator [Syntrophomonadaceae bacterium]HPR94058.1 TetR/AcrR family transcriptional regulator [Syntrophomonadaceae bacterium]
MIYSEFKKMVNISKEEISGQILEHNRDSIKVKKEQKVIENLIKIIDATLDICSKKSFQAMSIRDLSAASGLSRGALYSYFTSKEELLVLILSQGREIANRVLTEQIARGSSPAEKLRLAIKSHIYLSEAMQTWFYFTYIEARNLPRDEQKRAIESELYTEKIFIDIIEAGITEKVFRDENVILAASVIKAMLQDWYLKRWKYKNRKVSVDDYADFVSHVAESILLIK